jgi:nitrite reductase/ring-hydroxylating ferredoxin subunit
MMVILEVLSRAYYREHEAENFEAVQPIDRSQVLDLAVETYEKALGMERPVPFQDVVAGRAEEIPDGERKIIQVGDRSIGVFHHRGKWYALRNSCLHRGGPVCTGTLQGDTLTCPWHGFQYNVTTGRLIVDPSIKLETYDLTLQDGEIHLQVPDKPAGETTAHIDVPPPADEKTAAAPAEAAEEPTVTQDAQEAIAVAKAAPMLQENEFFAGELAPGHSRLVQVNGQKVAVFNVDGTFYATQDKCTHVGGPLSQGTLTGETIVCPWHGSCFNVRTGAVECGPAKVPIKTFVVVMDGEVVRVQ